MDANFWHKRWQRQEIGFHLEQVNAHLPRHWPQLVVEAGSKVLVPLCGKSVDLCWLAQQGFSVLGVELSQCAVEAFFQEQQMTPQVRAEGDFQVYQCGLIELWCGDFFALSAEHVSQCAAFYDRAAMIALPENMRRSYIEHLQRILPASCQGLLVTLEYEQSLRQGPPFAVLEAHVGAAYGAPWQLEMLAREDVLQDSWSFLQSGIPSLHEAVYRVWR